MVWWPAGGGLNAGLGCVEGAVAESGGGRRARRIQHSRAGREEGEEKREERCGRGLNPLIFDGCGACCKK
jgi:hypothetical protein